MLNLLFANPPAFIIIFGGLILAIGIHEAAHAFTADYLGDPTPRSLGRTTLNPLAHLDPLGTLVILVTGYFGWGKPAPFDPYNLLAGPASNFVMAVILSLISRLSFPNAQVATIITTLIILNVNLALFNLLPVPPLDGSKIAGLFMSHEQAVRFRSQTNPLLLLLLILPIIGGASLAYLIIFPVSRIFLGFLLP